MHFIDNYSKIKFPVASYNSNDGLRNAQLGAIHSIASHFTTDEINPALVVMPTGSGKTAVLIMSSYLLRAKRVLVLSSSVLVRGQIAEEFRYLTTLKKIKVVDEDLKAPNVYEITGSMRDQASWLDIAKYDVVVGIPSSISSGIEQNFSPAKTMFDLILVDEAHHTAARTWTSVLSYFNPAKKILFTATPFRRDKQEVPGKIVFSYPLSKAQKDKIFGPVQYYPVLPVAKESTDIALAKAAENALKLDRKNGLDHFMLVRTDSKKHADQLLKIYSENTELKLRKIDSSKSYRYIKQTISSLIAKRLDGIICVDMLGEGFDFPNLKIGVIHRPHKSLAITLQFIGRFARTNASNIGQAKFLAVPNDIKLLRAELYEENAVWDELIVDLSEYKIGEEDSVKKFIHNFEKVVTESSEENISLYNIHPYCHVKIYRLADFVSPQTIPIRGHETVYYSQNLDECVFVLVTKETTKPRWLISHDLANSSYYLFIIYYDIKNRLLFINSDFKTEEFYEFIASCFSTEDPEKIPKKDLHKVLSGLKDTEFFNIGMFNRSYGSGESYKIISGSKADNTIKRSDARTYSNGHVFGKAVDEQSTSITIGYSRGSKVWSNAYLKIPLFISWCKAIASKINSEAEVRTYTGLDNLPIGSPISEFPSSVFAATWDRNTFLYTPFLEIIETDSGQIFGEYQLLEFEIVIDRKKSNNSELFFYLDNSEYVIPLKFTFSNHFEYAEAIPFGFTINKEESVIDYLNENPLLFFLDDFSTIIHAELHKNPSIDELKYNVERVKFYDWQSLNADITIEFYDSKNSKAKKKIDNNNRLSVHDCLDNLLVDDKPDVLIYDHRSGEIADYISLSGSGDFLHVKLFHCKGSNGDNPGLRVDDLYEVCGQAIKCLLWTNSKVDFKNKLDSRLKSGSKFLIGDEILLNDLFKMYAVAKFSICIVQPGLSILKLKQNNLDAAKISSILAAAESYVHSNGHFEQFEIYGSNY